MSIDLKKDEITVYNNGQGIPIQMHPKEKVYIPELVFGHMLTGSNYEDQKQKTTGGRNGLGAKLTNIFSKSFTVTTADTKRRQLYKQTFAKNLSQVKPAVITAYSPDCSDYTEVKFTPDLARFDLKSLTDDIVGLMAKRVYDLAGVTPSTLSVHLNGKKVQVKNFETYCKLFTDQ